MKNFNLREFIAWRADNITAFIIVLLSLAYIITGKIPLLVIWEAVVILYLLIGTIVIWNKKGHYDEELRELAAKDKRWAWIMPILSSLTGAYTAVIALVTMNDDSKDPGHALLAGAACLGIILSWMMLQVGFAHIYAYFWLTQKDPVFDFPGTKVPNEMDFMYFAFTIGASFATSDVNVVSQKARRIVIMHSMLVFFFNAIVLAVAFQVLQQAIA